MVEDQQQPGFITVEYVDLAFTQQSRKLRFALPADLARESVASWERTTREDLGFHLNVSTDSDFCLVSQQEERVRYHLHQRIPPGEYILSQALPVMALPKKVLQLPGGGNVEATHKDQDDEMGEPPEVCSARVSARATVLPGGGKRSLVKLELTLDAICNQKNQVAMESIEFIIGKPPADSPVWVFGSAYPKNEEKTVLTTFNEGWEGGASLGEGGKASLSAKVSKAKEYTVEVKNWETIFDLSNVDASKKIIQTLATPPSPSSSSSLTNTPDTGGSSNRSTDASTTDTRKDLKTCSWTMVLTQTRSLFQFYQHGLYPATSTHSLTKSFSIICEIQRSDPVSFEQASNGLELKGRILKFPLKCAFKFRKWRDAIGFLSYTDEEVVTGELGFECFWVNFRGDLVPVLRQTQADLQGGFTYAGAFNSDTFQRHYHALQRLVDQGDPNWPVAWAKRMNRPTEEDSNLDISRKHCLSFLYRIYDDCQHYSAKKKKQLRDELKPQHVSNLLHVCLPMDRANALYHMQVGERGSGHPRGMHWIAKKHVEENELYGRVWENYKGSFHTQNKRFPWLIATFQLDTDQFKDVLKPVFIREEVGDDAVLQELENQVNSGNALFELMDRFEEENEVGATIPEQGLSQLGSTS